MAEQCVCVSCKNMEWTLDATYKLVSKIPCGVPVPLRPSTAPCAPAPQPATVLAARAAAAAPPAAQGAPAPQPAAMLAARAAAAAPSAAQGAPAPQPAAMLAALAAAAAPPAAQGAPAPQPAAMLAARAAAAAPSAAQGAPAPQPAAVLAALAADAVPPAAQGAPAPQPAAVLAALAADAVPPAAQGAPAPQPAAMLAARAAAAAPSAAQGAPAPQPAAVLAALAADAVPPAAQGAPAPQPAAVLAALAAAAVPPAAQGAPAPSIAPLTVADYVMMPSAVSAVVTQSMSLNGRVTATSSQLCVRDVHSLASPQAWRNEVVSHKSAPGVCEPAHLAADEADAAQRTDQEARSCWTGNCPCGVCGGHNTLQALLPPHIHANIAANPAARQVLHDTCRALDEDVPERALEETLLCSVAAWENKVQPKQAVMRSASVQSKDVSSLERAMDNAFGAPENLTLPSKQYTPHLSGVWSRTYHMGLALSKAIVGEAVSAHKDDQHTASLMQASWSLERRSVQQEADQKLLSRLMSLTLLLHRRPKLAVKVVYTITDVSLAEALLRLGSTTDKFMSHNHTHFHQWRQFTALSRALPQGMF
uniref:Uncharacterized protein n=1 Tax=Monostroma angicava TaxID=189348 RepID=A0A7U3NA08_9CHLO|nr:hypothetical protein [Monostroma angicava]